MRMPHSSLSKRRGSLRRLVLLRIVFAIQNVISTSRESGASIRVRQRHGRKLWRRLTGGMRDPFAAEPLLPSPGRSGPAPPRNLPRGGKRSGGRGPRPPAAPPKAKATPVLNNGRLPPPGTGYVEWGGDPSSKYPPPHSHPPLQLDVPATF